MTRRTFWLGATGVAGCLVIVIGTLWIIPALLYPPLPDADLRRLDGAQARIQLQQAQGELRNNARTTLLQAIAGLLLVGGAAATWRQVQVTKDGQITDRFSRATEHLGHDNVDVRIGGVYALERIAKNSPADRVTVQFILGAFVRNHSPWRVHTPGGVEHPTTTVEDRPWLQVIAPDIHCAVSVLARRPCAPDANKQYPAGRQLYLSQVDLRGLQLFRGQLTYTQLTYANLARSWLQGTQFDHSKLQSADLRGCDLQQATFVEANLAYAYLNGADLRGADLRGADLRGTDLRDANLDGATLDGARTDAATRWPPDVEV